MNTPDFGSELQVVPGDGRLARRAKALLFSPAGDSSGLVAAFDAAPSAEAAVTALQSLVVAAGFDVPPFAVVNWDAGVHLFVFGAVEVVTSLATVPMISGAGSGTWVEHRVAAAQLDATVQVSVAGPAEADGDLRLGVTRSGGFVLALDVSPVSSASAVTAAPAPAPAPAVVQPAPVVATPVIPSSEPTPVPTPVSPSLATASASTPEDSAEDEDEPTLQDGAVSAAQDEEIASDGRLVEAHLCSAGHANRPGARVCRVCGSAVQDAEVSFVAQPTLGILRLADGSVIELDRTMVIGRKPKAAEPGDATVVVAGDDVSRSHVRVVVQAWDVFISDLSSRNGTYLRVGNDPNPAQLDAGVEQILEPDTTIHLGSADVAIRFERGEASTT